MEKILVTENEVSIATLITYNFEQGGYCFKAARDGVQACLLIESFLLDLAILEPRLPLKNG